MAMRTINVMLPAEPTEGTDPLGGFLLLDQVRDGLLRLGIDPGNTAHVERDGRQSLNIHFSAEGDTGMRLSVLLEGFRALFHYTTGIVVPYESPPENLPPDTFIALAK